MSESQKVRDARDRRVSALCYAVIEWRRLAEQKQYPRSLHTILFTALEREYLLGATRVIRPRQTSGK